MRRLRLLPQRDFLNPLTVRNNSFSLSYYNGRRLYILTTMDWGHATRAGQSAAMSFAVTGQMNATQAGALSLHNQRQRWLECTPTPVCAQITLQ